MVLDCMATFSTETVIQACSFNVIVKKEKEMYVSSQ